MRIVVGRVGKPHGVRGEVTVEPRTDEPELRFAEGADLLTESGSLHIESVRFHQGTPLVAFRGVHDRTGAESLRNTLLYIESDLDEPSTDPDEFWDHELIGMTALDDSGAVRGRVHDVLHLPGQDLLAVTRDDGSEVLVPFVRAIVPSIDRAAGTLVVLDPGGLFDESEAAVADETGA
ncbi:MAG: ribosome maturation factor RimM [Actinomycetales bacterium]|nr:ribosome maturation factor RimM [Actinomycetales bacterium]